ncbi:MAG: MarR family transcriptional regulator [Dehalococcoidia bacterium]
MQQTGAATADPRTLQERMTTFVRAFGLHRPEETPCGQPIPASEAHALLELAGGVPLSQKALGARIRLDKSTVSRLVARLEERAWVRRDPHPGDGRSVLLCLTTQGRLAAERLAAARTEKFSELFAAIAEEERGAVLHALATLTRALDEALPPGEHAIANED